MFHWESFTYFFHWTSWAQWMFWCFKYLFQWEFELLHWVLKELIQFQCFKSRDVSDTYISLISLASTWQIKVSTKASFRVGLPQVLVSSWSIVSFSFLLHFKSSGSKSCPKCFIYALSRTVWRTASDCSRQVLPEWLRPRRDGRNRKDGEENIVSLMD